MLMHSRMVTGIAIVLAASAAACTSTGDDILVPKAPDPSQQHQMIGNGRDSTATSPGSTTEENGSAPGQMIGGG